MQRVGLVDPFIHRPIMVMIRLNKCDSQMVMVHDSGSQMSLTSIQSKLHQVMLVLAMDAWYDDHDWPCVS